MRLSRANTVFLFDLSVAAASLPAALFLRVGAGIVDQFDGQRLYWMMGLFVLIAAFSFRTQNMYRGVWRYASLNDMVAILRGVSLSVLLYTTVLFLLIRLEDFPRSTVIIQWFVLVAALAAPRFAYRSFKDRRLAHKQAREIAHRQPVLLIGAGDEADLFLRALKAQGGAVYRVHGLIADKPGRVGRHIQGVPVLGLLDDLPGLLDDFRAQSTPIEKLILTRDGLTGADIDSLMALAESRGIGLARLPRPGRAETAGADALAPRIESVAIADLLQRPQAVLDRSGIESIIRGQTVMVTGAGGTIGGELVRQIVELGPGSLVLFENGEYALYRIEAEVRELAPDLSCVAYLGDIRDAARLDEVMAAHSPAAVFHAAALKHVPMVEANPVEGVFTNAVGTRMVVDACRRHGVDRMVMISTDKAVNPTNVMGASKRLAERYCQAVDAAPEAGLRIVTVRFGNVLGSTGSVVPLFQRQLARGGPLTVTHPEMTRYFMTVREAVALVLQAAALAPVEAGERGALFVLDMGKPVKILDLAKQMIRLAGLKPETDVKIVFTGLRPGEKMFEEIFHGAEELLPTAQEGVLTARPRAGDLEALIATFDDLSAACRARETARVLDILAREVPEYRPQTMLSTAARAGTA